MRNIIPNPLPVNSTDSTGSTTAGAAFSLGVSLKSKVDERRPVRILLIQMPFFRLTAPSISLATLESALHRAQINCDLEHLNLDFGRRIGRERYTWLAVGSPPYLLVGDLIFAPSLNGRPLGRDQVAGLVASLGTRAEGGVPDWVVADFPELVAAADDFLDHHIRSISWHEYDLVGLSTIFNVTPALALARRIKQCAHAPAIVLGGSNCEGEMGETLHRKFPFVDFVCRGEGEQLIVELARSFAAGQPSVVAMPGLVWRQDGQTLLDPRRASTPQACDSDASGPLSPHGAAPGPFPLDALPIPRYHRWLKQVRGTGMFADSELQLPIETSRGCWYGEKRNCLFCGLNGPGLSYRRKSSERILEELQRTMGYGIKVLHCVDNILDPAYFDDVLPRLAELNAGCEIFWPVRPDLGRGQLALLQRCGVCWIQVGIESLSTSVLHLMGKGTTAFQNVRLLRNAAEFGLGTSWNVLFGFVGEDPEAYRQMAALMPALAHLQPPRMTYQIRMDRFAPLFDLRHGVKNVAPARAYHDLFPFEDATVERLATYFEYEYAAQPDPFSYVDGCLEAIAGWRREVGRAALICFDSGATLHVCDSRPIATQRHTALRGAQRDILKATANGIDGAALAARIGASPHELEVSLGELLDRRWIVLLDGKYLSLVVPVDPWVPAGVPPLMVRGSLEDLYRRRLLFLHDASSGMKRRVPSGPGTVDPQEAACP